MDFPLVCVFKGAIRSHLRKEPSFWETGEKATQYRNCACCASKRTPVREKQIDFKNQRSSQDSAHEKIFVAETGFMSNYDTERSGGHTWSNATQKIIGADKMCPYSLNFFFKVYLLIWERGRERERERERERGSQAGSVLSAQSPTRGSSAWTVKSWPERKSRVRCLTNWATQVSQQVNFDISMSHAILGAYLC